MKTLSLLFVTVNILLNNWHSESSCPKNQVVVGSSCECDKGFMVDGDVCKKCREGSYKAEVGNKACTKCPEHSACTADRTGFTCDAGYSSSNNDCECDRGFGLVDDSCEMCDENYFKSYPGNFNCYKCFLNSVSIDDRTNCICKAGFGHKGFYNCDKCSSGTYKAEIGNNECIVCLKNLVSNNERTDCACDAGFNLVDGACKKCSEGSYKAEISNETCTKCPDHSTCNDDRTDFTCNAGYSTVDNDCVCDAGFRHNGTDCEECSEGSFKAEIGNEKCTPCPDHSTCNNDRTGFSCDSGYVTDNNNCVCDAGFGHIAAVCEECSNGSYKAEIGNDPCKKCSTFFTTEFKRSTNEKSCNVKRKDLIAGVTIAGIIAICTIVVVIVLSIKSQRN